jgi:hypothetical protein
MVISVYYNSIFYGGRVGAGAEGSSPTTGPGALLHPAVDLTSAGYVVVITCFTSVAGDFFRVATTAHACAVE